MYNLSVSEFNCILSQTAQSGSNLLNITPYKYNESEYKIVRYDKTMLGDNNELGMFRSVILNSDNKVISFSPPKSLSLSEFINRNPNKTSSIIVEELIEGTMINVFWDASIMDWNISTRNTVGANNYFYKSDTSISFKQMFEEALKECNIDLSLGNKEYCYSYVLQHPNNRIVIPVKSPTLFLVQVYQISHTDTECVVNVVPMETVQKDEHWLNSFIRFPVHYSDWAEYTELKDKYVSENSPYDFMGIVIKNTLTNERCKMRNPVYEGVWKLKGNQPKLQYQYLVLRKIGKIGEYLKYYPEYKNEFSKFRDQLHVFTNNLFDSYVKCYIKKEKPLAQFSLQYRTHMYNLHRKFLSELKEEKKYITLPVVINYVNNLSETFQMHSLHCHLKKRYLDEEAIRATTTTPTM